MGENREVLLREFLAEHLPRRYGVAKGEIVTRQGDQSHSADVIVYDNQLSSSTEGTLTEGTAIGGGTITIHASKN